MRLPYLERHRCQSQNESGSFTAAGRPIPPPHRLPKAAAHLPHPPPRSPVEPNRVLIIHSLFCITFIPACLSTHILGIIAHRAVLQRVRGPAIPPAAFPSTILAPRGIPHPSPLQSRPRARFLRSCSNEPRPESAPGVRPASCRPRPARHPGRTRGACLSDQL